MIRAAILFLLASLAQAQSFNVQPDPVPITVICPSGTATASGNTYTCPGNIPPPPTCSGYTVVKLGALPIDGSQTNSAGVDGNDVAYGTISIPSPLPAGWLGKVSSAAVLANGSGNAWRKVYLSQKPCDFTATAPAFVQGQTATISFIYGANSPYAVRVEPGQTWYLNIKDELPFGGPSCNPGTACDFGVRVYPPS